MAKPRRSYQCKECEWSTPKWMGKCGGCQTWNSLEEVIVAGGNSSKRRAMTTVRPTPLHEVSLDGGGEVRVRTGIDELDTVLGGGLVSGSLTLLGGDPGVGKSTLLLMALDKFASKGLTVVYVSGEESLKQVRMRADRLGVASQSLQLLAETDFDVIEQACRATKPRVVVLDSVQTVHVAQAAGIPGSVSQVREVAHRTMKWAKSTGTSVFLVGHVTKSGQLAGPKVLEHFVDTVLYFEGDGRSSLRVLRAVKNRFGASGELGLFEMSDGGLVEVPDASARLLSERVAGAPGTAVVATLEGSRPLLTEVQALVGPSGAYTPGRTCVGVDRTRVTMLIAVLGKCGFNLADRGVFVKAAGGVRLDEPAADLGILAAMLSSLRDAPVREDVVVYGEVGLVGEVRSVSHPIIRLKEAARHGFRNVVAPATSVEEVPPGIDASGVKMVREALELLF